MNTKQACLAIAILSAGAAQAQWYAEIGVTPLQVKGTVEGDTLRAKPTVAGVIFGYELHPNWAIEGMAATHLDADTISLNGSDVTGTSLKVKSAYGLFIKPKAMLTPELELFGRLGWVENKTSGQVGNLSLTDTDNDFAYGLGLNYHFSKTTYGSLAYTNLYDKQGTKTQGITLGLGMKF